MIKCGMLLLALVLSGNPPAEPAPGHGTNIASPTPAQLKGIEAFWRTCLGKEAIGTLQMLGESRGNDRFPAGSLAARVSGGVPAETAEIDFSCDDGTLYTYDRLGWMDEPGTEGRTNKDAIPEDKAWERASSVLRYLGLPTLREDYKIALQDYGGREHLDDLYAAHWEILKNLTYKNWKCPGSYVTIYISANSSDIVMVLYSPVIVPKVEHKQNVSQVEAIEKARAWLKSTELLQNVPFEGGAELASRVEEVIARPHDPGLSPSGKGVYPDNGESFYCWQVPFGAGAGEGAFGFNIFVRIDNGDVIGSL